MWIQAVVAIFFLVVAGTHALTPPAIERLQQELEQTRQCRHVVGLSVSLVHGQETVFSAGFGLANVEARTPMTADTVLAIGSVTKVFTVELLTQLLYEQDQTSFSWNTPVREILGESFRLSDEIMTDHVTLGDILAHKLGVPGYTLALQVGYPSSVTLQELVRRLRYMCPTASFRQTYMYNNYMYGLAGYIAEKLAGDLTWEELIRQRIFRPLGMLRSGFVDGEHLPDDFAQPYTEISGDNVAVPMETLRTVSPIGPAGSIASSADDMALWMKYLLAKYTTASEDKQLRLKAYKPHMAAYKADYNIIRRPVFPVALFGQARGYAWMLSNYRGFKLVDHGGAISTFSSKLVLIPDAQIGIYVANNGPSQQSTSRAQKVLMMHLMDHALGLEPWLNVSTLCSFPEPWIPARGRPNISPAEHESNIAADEDTLNGVSLQNFAGVYGHPGFGEMTVYVNATDSHLHVKYGRLGRAILYRFREPGLFVWLWRGDLWFDTTDFPVNFTDYNQEGQARAMSVLVAEMRHVIFTRNYDPRMAVSKGDFCNLDNGGSSSRTGSTFKLALLSMCLLYL